MGVNEARWRTELPWGFLSVLGAIVVLGVFNLYSATYENGEMVALYKSQLVWIGVGGIALILMAYIDFQFLERSSHVILLFNILLLLAVLAVGLKIAGARRWLSLAGWRIQPSEFVKLALIFSLARYFHRDQGAAPYYLRRLILPFLMVGVVSLLTLLQPDLGTAGLIFLISFSMMIFVGIRRRSLISLFLLALIVIPIGWKFHLKDYQKYRVLSFVNPASDPRGKGYHALQSVIAIGSGRSFGKGHLQGTQAQLEFLPEKHTDFIFSVFAEEHGFFGGILLLSLYGLLLFIGLSIARKAKDSFSLFVGIGAISLLFWHIVINIAMAARLFPIVGVTLPFMSYGGSSLLTCFVAAGLLVNIHRNKFLF